MVRIYYEKDGITYRSLLAYADGTWLIEYDCPKEPFMVTHEELGSFHRTSAPDAVMQAPGSSYEDTKQKRLKMLQELIGDERCIVDRKHRNGIIQAITGRSGTSAKTIRKWFYAYLAGGENALYTKPKKKKQRELTPDERNFRWALNRYHYSSRRATLRNTYDLMLVARYTDGEGHLLEQYPTWGQFRYFYYSKTQNPVKKVISQNGIGHYQRNARPLYGRADQGHKNIGVFQLDATIADIHLVSRHNRKQVIGRPNIYLAVDTVSRLIAGVYVGLEAGEEAVAELLRQAAMDKIEYCKRFGIDIQAEQWPNRGLPGELVTDGGREFISGRMDEICARHGIVSTALPPYRPELKGLVESSLNSIQERYQYQLIHLGVIDDDFQQKGLPDYRREACLNLYEFTQIVIHSILYLNSKRVLQGYIGSQEMAEDGVSPIASELWLWHQKKGYSNIVPVSDDDICHVLLPRTTGYFTRKGLEFRYLTYWHPDYNTRCAAAGLNGKEQVQIAYDPQNTSRIFLMEDGEYIPFDLTPSKEQFRGSTYTEVQAFLDNEGRIKRDLQAQDTAGRVETAGAIKEIAKAALAQREELHDMDTIEAISLNREKEKWGDLFEG
ncbi:DDE-type integrase/transposase/recombinase [Clostridia bacterium OttesenSCG-928-F22]|nr:DDE-type integrase/transposase/recombinase [Clostridia bacterium OttesenSCG-928-F22]